MVEDDDRTTAVDEVQADLERTVEDVRLGPGTDVGGYIIDGELGRGGMGFVYSATHPVIGKRAAIKVLKPEVSKNPTIVSRFIQEARAVNQIHHPNIIDIFAFGQLPDGRAYHVMDLLVGETLRRRLKRGPLHASEAASVIDETALALTAAHDKGFVHRDLKPDNIFLVQVADRWPEVKLLDFGLAKLMPEAGVAAFTTKTGMMLGTPEYMSPEQARGIGVDYRTDIYALGVMTFEMLAGQRPFASLGDAFATLQQHAEEPPPSLAALVPGLPEEMTQLVDAMLAKEPAARPSLAAVRTVIKRLRTTQLPSRTAAGLELASIASASASAPKPAHRVQQRTPPTALDMSASRLGADPVVDARDLPRVSRPSSNPPLGSRDSSRASQPQTPIAEGPPQRPSQPPSVSGSSISGSSAPSSNPPSPYTHGGAAHSSSSRPKFIPNVTPGPSNSGLAAPQAKIAATRLGVPPPPKRSSQEQEALTKPAPAPARRSNHLWLIIGALLAIGAGVLLALVVVGK